MKISVALIATLTASPHVVSAFLLPLAKKAVSRCDSLARYASETSNDSNTSRRSFLNHVVTATTAGTLSTISFGPAQPALATDTTTLAGQIELPPMGLGAWAWGTSNTLAPTMISKYSLTLSWELFRRFFLLGLFQGE